MGLCCCRSTTIEPLVDNIENLTKDRFTEQQIVVKKRSCTNIFSLILMITFIVGLTILIGYCILHGDIYRIINGYDDCANVCGQTNYNHAELIGSCKREDMSMKRFLVITPEAGSGMDKNKIHRECVESCDSTNYREFFNRCIPNKSATVINPFFSKTGIANFFQEVSEDFHLCWTEILYLSATAFGFSIIILILFRYMAGFIVWLVLIAASITAILATIFLWTMWLLRKRESNQIDIENQDNLSQRSVTTYLVGAIIATIITFIVILIIIVMRKRIKLVIQLFKEAGKAIADMPILLLEPILTCIFLCLIIFVWMYVNLWIESSGFPVIETNQSLHYQKNDIIKATRWYNLFALFWFTQFTIGCQHMIIAGAVSTWFFTRNKKKLNYPILKSFKHLIFYHLGSVAFGSLLIAFVQILKSIFQTIQYSLKNSGNSVAECMLRCCGCCLNLLEKFLKYFSRNAYIEIAIHGDGFCKSGQRAFSILTSNALRVIAINSVGDFVLFLGKVFVIIATILVGFELIQKKEGIQHAWVILLIVGLIAYLTSNCFITVYEMTIDTIFICFCEDCAENDGISKPYYMNRGLMEFVQNSKKSIGNTEETESQAWTSKSFA